MCTFYVVMAGLICGFAGFVLGGVLVSHAYQSYDRKFDDQLKHKLNG